MAQSDSLERIIIGCKRGNCEDFSRLVDIYTKRCYGYFYRLTGSREVSDDLLGELFVKLVEKIGSYRGGRFESWLFKVASNVFTDYLRGKRRRERLLDGQKERIETEKAKEPDDERIDELQRRLGELDGETRELIVLRYYSGLSFKEIAEMRSEPIGTTLSKVHRGLKRLRELMEL